jgi:hypothetical protein
MTKAEEILANYPSVKLGLDEHYGKQTVLNALNEALRIHDVVGRSEQLIALQNIEKICDNQNPTHEEIWRIAYEAINSHTRFAATRRRGLNGNNF